MRFILFFFLFPFYAFADTFIVTSNADNGSGSLRQAITDAAVNGTSVTDTILFQIADNSRSGRTIQLNSELPALSSKLVIDGTSQQGTVFGLSDAKIIILNTTATSSFKFIKMYDVSDVELYGLYLFNLYWVFSSPDIRAIDFLRCKRLTIGKIGKGNFIRGIPFALRSTGSSADSSRSISIRSNVIGNDENGNISNTYPGNPAIYSVSFGIYFQNVYDISVGGTNPAEGNSIVAGKNSIVTDVTTGNGDINIFNNRFNLTVAGNIFLNGSSGNANETTIGAGVLGDYKLTYINNKHNGTLSINGLTKFLRVQGNEIFVPAFISSQNNRLSVKFCTGGGLIGGDGPGEPNKIYSNNTSQNYYGVSSPGDRVGVYLISSNITIKKNSIYCTAYYGSSIDHYNPPSYVRIDSTGIGFVRGKATPNSNIEVFLDDECLACEGKVYLGSTSSLGDSSWSFSGSFNTVVVATATNGSGSTSGFSTPEADFYSPVVNPSRCGLKNGSIVGMQAKGYDRVEWRHYYFTGTTYKDSVVGNTLDIYNLAPGGRYYFHAWLGNSCRGYPQPYTIDSVNKPRILTSVPVIIHPSCGKFNGSINTIKVNQASYYKAYWKDMAGQVYAATVVSNNVSLLDAGPGSYKLIIQDTVGGCADSTAFYNLVNQSGPTVVLTSMVMAHSTCGQSNGAITGLSIQNATGVQNIRWEDSSGTIVGTALNLINIPAGKYKFKFKDGSSCDTIVSSFYTILNNGLITIDTSQMIIKSSACNLGTGSIDKIIIIGGDTFIWTNIVNSQIAGSASSLNLVSSGSYQLTVRNNYGCSKNSAIFFIPQSGFSPIKIVSLDSVPANCDLNNGFIKPLSFSADTANYVFSWTNISNGTIVSSYTSAFNLAAGTYALVARDTNSCISEIYRTTIIQTSKPLIDVSAANLVHDTCDNGSGNISNINVSGGGGNNVWQWTRNNVAFPQLSSSINKLHHGIYQPSVTDKYGCKVSGTPIILNNINVPLPLPVASDQKILINTKANIIVNNVSSGNYLLFTQLPANLPFAISATGLLVTPPVPTDTVFYILHEKGTCSSPLKPVMIKVFETTLVTFPNAFSPNGDGVNDLWKPYQQGIVIMKEWKLFNRYGQKLSTSIDLIKGWDGTINGSPVPIGIYYYIFSALDNNGNAITSSGSVTLLR